MNSSLQASFNALNNPEVQDAMKLLGKYGLGVFMPHIHTTTGMEPLPRGIVQLEQQLHVSFVPEDNPGITSAVPVGWVWDQDSATVVSKCYCCGQDDSCFFRGDDLSQ